MLAHVVQNMSMFNVSGSCPASPDRGYLWNLQYVPPSFVVVLFLCKCTSTKGQLSKGKGHSSVLEHTSCMPVFPGSVLDLTS